MNKNKPNCYECVHRGTNAGTHHSRCLHPNNKQVLDNPIFSVVTTFASVGRTAPISFDTGLNIKAKKHGIEKGWFNWPHNFDPVWLISCDGFEQKQEVENEN